MNEKLRRLARLMEMRKTRERLSEATVAVEIGKLYAVEQRLAAVKERETSDADEMRKAMVMGERGEWMQALALSEVDRRDRVWCEAERRECGVVLEAAREVLRIRRIETEQADVLLRDAREVAAVKEARCAQAESDDRFLARSRWLTLREGVKVLMNSA